MGGDGARPTYDVAIVGAGPAGATAAYDLARAGRRVVMLEKARFPRDKYCGDAWCEPALRILEEMGILAELERQGAARKITAGGFVSPSGESFITRGDEASGTRVYAIKRKVCDERIARAAQRAGAELVEDAHVVETTLGGDGTWTIGTKGGLTLRARALVAADGAVSRIARRLGVVTAPAAGSASRQYLAPGTHNFEAHGVLFYPRYILPGYVALFRHADDSVDLGCYVIPGGTAEPGDLKELYATKIREDPFLRAALGARAEPLEPVRIAPLRLGGEPRTVGERLLVVGDAAGHIDPLTGEGIHTAMTAGRIAAETLHAALATGDLSAGALARYHDGWMRAFGREFRSSALAARAIHRFPVVLDAANKVAQRRGDAFMEEFGAAMTGLKPKSVFLKPSLAAPLGIALLRELTASTRRAGPPERGYRAAVERPDARPTSFHAACLRQGAAT